jgi:hypothetical protein
MDMKWVLLAFVLIGTLPVWKAVALEVVFWIVVAPCAAIVTLWRWAVRRRYMKDLAATPPGAGKPPIDVYWGHKRL